MPIPMSCADVLDQYFLEMRHKVLDVAAALDRVDRADGDVSGDPRVDALKRAIAVLLEDAPGRAERVLTVFSDEYDPNWRGHASGAS